jgi:hypothetical protein|tara:strand:+ start:662 stop:1351 length:690 start_codon:yes stop_codon:yes gene_type:complete
MATINTSKAGYIAGRLSNNFTTARQTGSSTVTAPSGNEPIAIMYKSTSSRGSTLHQMYRTFLYFDTSAIQNSVTSATLSLTGVTNMTADVIVLRSTAFGGNGNSNLVTGDFYSTVQYNSAYSAEYTGWGGKTGAVSIPLGSGAESDMQNNSAFICAIVEHDYDYNNTSSGQSLVNHTNGIAFGSNITITYTEAGGGGGPSIKLNGVDSTNIDKWDGTTWSNISKINGVS